MLKKSSGVRMMRRVSLYLLSIATCLVAVGCTVEPTNQLNKNATGTSSPSATASPVSENDKTSNAQPLTLPVLDAFFADESFSELLKTRLQLTDEQVTRLKELAHSETAKLNERNAGTTEGESAAARALAEEKISALIGEEKKQQLATLVGER